MQQQTKILATLISIFLPIITHAEFPHDLIYKDKPIDSLCFFETDAKKPAMPLAKCGIGANYDRIIIDTSPEMKGKGYTGYDYRSPIDLPGITAANCYSYYKVAGTINGTHIIYTVNGTGGSGSFTGIVYARRDKENLIVDPVTSGDRCNGGIENVAVKDDKIIYDQNLTAFDVFELGEQNPKKITAYDDLAACAACCAATATFEFKPGQPARQHKLVSVDFGKDIVKPTHDAQGKYQFCFDSLVAEYQKGGKSRLNPEQVAEFVKLFNSRCVT